MKLLSVVLPAYNEEQMIEETWKTLERILKKAEIPFELVFVNDGSSDHTWEKIETISRRDSQVTGVCFSRNFGKEAAIVAGLAHAKGEAVAVMDCDLQHPPETLIRMYQLWMQGYEVVEGVKKDRGKESFFHKECAGFFIGLCQKRPK